MGMHYIIQGIFVVVGLLAILASLFNWNWFFQSQNTQFIVNNVGRKRARLFYALLGLLMIATAVYFFFGSARSHTIKKDALRHPFLFYSSSKESPYSISPCTTKKTSSGAYGPISPSLAACFTT